MRKIIIISVLLLLGVATTAYLYFDKLNNSHQNNDVALQTALQSSFLTVSFNNESTFYEVMRDYPLFDELLGEDKRNEMLALNHLILKNNQLNKWIANRKVFISLIPDGKSTFDLLYVVQLNEAADVEKLLKEMNTEGTKATIVDGQFKIEGQLNEVFYAMVKNNTAIVSKNTNLVKMIANDKLNNIDTESKEFLENYRSSSKNSLAQMYINTQKTDILHQTLLVNRPPEILNEIAQMQAFSILNFNYGKNKLQFSGASLSTSKHHFFNSFMQQKAQNITIPTILPASTATYSIYTISDFETWQKDLILSMETNNSFGKTRKKVFDKIQKQDSINPVALFNQLKLSEFAFIEFNNGEKLGVIKCNTVPALDSLFKNIIQKSTDSTYRFTQSEILPALFGDIFDDYHNPYLKVKGNYLLIANNLSTIKEIENIHQPEDLLINTPNYIDFSAQIIPEANISFFINNLEGKTLLRKKIRWELFQYYIPDKSPYHKVYGMGVQLSAEDNTLQTTITVTNRVDRTNFD